MGSGWRVRGDRSPSHSSGISSWSTSGGCGGVRRRSTNAGGGGGGGRGRGEVKEGPEALLARAIHGDTCRVDRVVTNRLRSHWFGALQIERRGGSDSRGWRGGSRLRRLLFFLVLVGVMGGSRGQKGRNAAAPGAVVSYMGRIGRGGGGGVVIGVGLNGVHGAKGGRRGVIGGRRGVKREEGAGRVRGGNKLSKLLLEAESTDPAWIWVALVRMLAALHPFFLHGYTSPLLFSHFSQAPPPIKSRDPLCLFTSRRVSWLAQRVSRLFSFPSLFKGSKEEPKLQKRNGERRPRDRGERERDGGAYSLCLFACEYFSANFLFIFIYASLSFSNVIVI